MKRASMIFAVLFISFFTMIAVHELGHYMVLKEEGIDSRFAISPNCNGGVVCVIPEKDYDKTFHIWWDEIWTLGLWDAEHYYTTGEMT